MGVRMTSPLVLSRPQILAFRRGVGALDQRLPPGRGSLRQAAWAGLQDSMPRAALLSLHARVKGVGPSAWEHPSLVQIWGPRFSAYVVPARDVAPFTLGRMPDDPEDRRKFEDLARRLHAFLRGRRVRFGDVHRPLALPHPNYVRYATITGRVKLVLRKYAHERGVPVYGFKARSVDAERPIDTEREAAS